MMHRILIISHKSPYAPLDGGVLAIRNFFEALCKHPNFEVFMFCIDTPKHKHDPQDHVFAKYCENHYIDTGLKPVEALKHLLRNSSYNLSRFYDKNLSNKIKNHLGSKDYDFVLFESLFSTVYHDDLKSVFSGKFLYRSHNVEYNIWDSLSNNEGNPFKKWYLKQLTKTLKEFETKIHSNMDAIFSISKDDLEYYKTNTDIPCYLLFFIREQLERVHSIQENAFFHLASMDWQPNIEAVEWFVEQVWKDVYAQDNSLVLYLAGKCMPKHYFNMQHLGIKAFDYIDEGDRFMQNHGTLIVPLFTGSGIRIKVVDALSIHVPILSTQLGVSGIGLEKDTHYVEANTAEEFKNAILSIGKKELDLNKMAKKSKIFAFENFEEHSVIQRFSNQLNQI